MFCVRFLYMLMSLSEGHVIGKWERDIVTCRNSHKGHLIRPPSYNSCLLFLLKAERRPSAEAVEFIIFYWMLHVNLIH